MKPLITLPCLALCACGAVNPVTALRLATLDPLTADPGAFIVRLDLPDGVGIEDGGATLSMQATRGADLADALEALDQARGEVMKCQAEALQRQARA